MNNKLGLYISCLTPYFLIIVETKYAHYETYPKWIGSAGHYVASYQM